MKKQFKNKHVMKTLFSAFAVAVCVSTGIGFADIAEAAQSEYGVEKEMTYSTEPVAEGSYTYETDYFTFTLPDAWKDKVEVRIYDQENNPFQEQDYEEELLMDIIWRASNGEECSLGKISTFDSPFPRNDSTDTDMEIHWNFDEMNKVMHYSVPNYLLLFGNVLQYTNPNESDSNDELTDEDKNELIGLITGYQHTLEECRMRYSAGEHYISEGDFLFYEVEANIVIKDWVVAMETKEEELPADLPEWNAAYLRYLDEHPLEMVGSFTLLDIDEDGIEEMIILTGADNNAEYRVYGCVNGDTVKLGILPSDYGRLYYYPKTHTLVGKHDGLTDYYLAVQYENGTWTEIIGEGEHLFNDFYSLNDFSIAGRRVTKDEYFQAIKEVQSGEGKVVEQRQDYNQDDRIILVPFTKECVNKYLKHMDQEASSAKKERSPYTPEPVKITDVSDNNGEFTVTWEKPNDKITGYQVQYKPENGTEFCRTIKGENTTSYTVSDWTSGPFKVTVRAYYKKDGQRYYSDWSVAGG